MAEAELAKHELAAVGGVVLSSGAQGSEAALSLNVQKKSVTVMQPCSHILGLAQKCNSL